MMIPTGNNLFVEPLKRVMSDGGIHLLEDNRDTMEYKVLAVGPGRFNRRGERVPIWPDIKPGDVVVSHAVLAQRFEVEGHLVRVLDAGQALAVISDEPI